VQDQFMENARPITLLITSADRTVPITVQQRSRLAPADSMALIGPIDLSRVFHPLAPFPGVASVANQTEAWDHPGPSRNPQFTDGSQADEQLIEYTAGSSFAYQLTGFTNILSAGPFKPLWRRYMMAALARCVEASESDFYSSTTGDQS
jgi:hypothetical protein